MDVITTLIERTNNRIDGLVNRVVRLEKIPIPEYTASGILFGGTNLQPTTDTVFYFNSGVDKLYVPNIYLEAWVAPTLLNSWVNYGGEYATAGYCKDVLGIVRLKGFIKDGTNTSGTTLFTLPSGYRPSERSIFITGSGSSALRVDVSANGDVYIITGSAANISLNNIFFRVA